MYAHRPSHSAHTRRLALTHFPAHLQTQPGQQSPQPEAYAKLEGENFKHYMRSLAITIGRKGSPRDEVCRALVAVLLLFAHAGGWQVDIDLGPHKIVSRKHARIEYNFVTRMFELTVQGKNGVYIDGKFVPKDSPPVPLETKCVSCEPGLASLH